MLNLVAQLLYSVCKEMYGCFTLPPSLFSLCAPGIIKFSFNYAIIGDWVYQAYGKRTLPPMMIFAGIVLVALVGTVILYKELTNKTLSEDKKKEIGQVTI